MFTNIQIHQCPQTKKESDIEGKAQRQGSIKYFFKSSSFQTIPILFFHCPSQKNIHYSSIFKNINYILS